MAEDNRPGLDDESDFDLRVQQILKVKDIDPDLLSSGSMVDLIAELEYVSDDNEIALRQQAMKELGYS